MEAYIYFMEVQESERRGYPLIHTNAYIYYEFKLELIKTYHTYDLL